MNQANEITKLNFEQKNLSTELDYLAPDKSEIRSLPVMRGGGLCHCTLPPGGISQAVKHKTVEEIWFFIQGFGQVWRKLDDYDEEVDARPGLSITIPPGTHFQFRNLGGEPLCFIIVSMPPWPGKDEAVRVEDHWSGEGG